MSAKHLKIIHYILIVFAIVLWIFASPDVFVAKNSGTDSLSRFSYTADIFYYLVQPIFSVVILWKARPLVGNLLFSLFLLSLTFVPTFYLIGSFTPKIAYTILDDLRISISIAVELAAFQYFPKKITDVQIDQVFRNKWLRRMLSASLGKRTLIVLAVLTFISLRLATTLLYDLITFAILFLIATFLYINYRCGNAEGRNRILWLFWGIMIYIIVFLLSLILGYFDNQSIQVLSHVLSILSVVALLLSVTMCLFFFDMFDTGVLVKRTLINSVLFILIILVYNTAEHYFLHWVAHTLHLSDVLTASIFSGILVMLFSPIHHKMTHFLEHRFKKDNGRPH